MYYTQTTGSAISDVTFQPAHNDSTASCEVESHVQRSSITVTERPETDMPLAVHTEHGAWRYCPQNTGGTRPVSIETGQAVRNWHVALGAPTDSQRTGGVVDLSTEIEMEYFTDSQRTGGLVDLSTEIDMEYFTDNQRVDGFVH